MGHGPLRGASPGYAFSVLSQRKMRSKRRYRQRTNMRRRGARRKMSDLTLLSGSFGTGLGSYAASAFRFPRRVRVGLEEIRAIGSQPGPDRTSMLGALGEGITSAAGFAPIGVVVAIFGSPAVVPAAITAAAIGGTIGLLRGGRTKQAILHVELLDGRTFAALCNDELPALIANEVRFFQKFESRQMGYGKLIEAKVAPVAIPKMEKETAKGPSLLELAATTFSGAASSVGTGLSAATTATSEAIGTATSAVTDAANDAVTSVGTNLSAATTATSEAIETAASAVADAANGAVTMAGANLSAAAAATGDALGTAAEAAVAAASATAAKTSEIVGSAAAGVAGTAASAFGRFRGLVQRDR